MKNFVYIVCCAALLFSCSKEDAPAEYGDDTQALVLNMQPFNPSVHSRATEPGHDPFNENKIENVHVFFFPQGATDNQVCTKYESFTGLSFQGTGVFSQALTTPRTIFNAGSTYDIYVIANLPSNVPIPAPMTSGAIKAMRTLTPITSTDLQSKFVMDSHVSAIPNPTQPVPIVNIDAPLRRAVSKIRVKLYLNPSAAVANSPLAQVSLRHFPSIGSCLYENPLVLTSGNYLNSSYVTATPATTFTFYCYENNWTTSPADETYLMVNLPYPLRPSNYYRIPINKYTNNAASGKIERNMIYDVSVYIDNDGTDNENGTVSVSGNCTITDWTTREVILRTITQHYLGISEYNIVMPNISTFILNYVSDLPVSVTNVTATCTQYSATGVASNVTYTSGQAQFPTFTVNAAARTITINSAIPINYVPKNMTFTVTNNQGLSLNATIVQYPARYVTARMSSGNIKPEWNTGGTNLNLFTVNTLVPSSNGSYTLGDPTNGFSKTDSTAIGNKVVSPRFIIASQYGIYRNVNYTAAQTRCYLYGEDQYRSGWRLPTKAEIELINAIQDDPNSAVKALLTGNAYWSAYKYDHYDFINNRWTSTNATGNAYVRAVYDLYKDER